MATYKTTSGGLARQQQNLPLKLLMDLIQQSNSGYQEARAANEERYNTILDRDLATRNRLLDYLQGFGQSMVSDTNRDWKNNLNNSLASLSQSGLLGSTVRSSVEARNERERQDALRRVKDTLTQNAIGIDERATNRLSDFQERRQDPYPDNSANNALIQQVLGLISQNGGLNGFGGLGGNNGFVQRGSSARAIYRSPQQLPSPTPATTPMAGIVAPRNLGSQVDSANQAVGEQARLMAQLHDAIQSTGTNSLTRQQRIDDALSQLVAKGYAQYHPEQGAPAVPVAPVMYGNNYAPESAAYQRVPLWARDPYYAQRTPNGRKVAAQKRLAENQFSALAVAANPWGALANIGI